VKTAGLNATLNNPKAERGLKAHRSGPINQVAAKVQVISWPQHRGDLGLS